MSDDQDSHYQATVQHYQNARKPDAYREVMREFAYLLSDPKKMSMNQQYTCRLLVALCKKKLNMFEEAKSLLRALLKDISNNPGENDVLIGTIKLELAEILRDTRDWDGAVTMFGAAAEYFRAHGDRLSEVGVYMTIANIWAGQNNFALADTALMNAWYVLQNLPESQLHIQVLYTRGHNYHLSGNQKSAIDLEEQALKIAKKLGDRDAEMRLTHNLAKFTFDIEDYHHSIPYHQRLLAIARADNNTQEILNHLLPLGLCYTETGQPQKAIETLEEIQFLNSNFSVTNPDILRLALIIKATALVDMKKHVKASSLLLQAKKIKGNSKDRQIDILEKRIAREIKGPMSFDCAHRVIKMAFGIISDGSIHVSPLPGFNLFQSGNLSPGLTNDEREDFERIYLEIPLVEAIEQPGENKDDPGALIIPLKFLYVEDPWNFAMKWHLFIQEKNNKITQKKIQEKWEGIDNKRVLSEGLTIENTYGYLHFIKELTDIAGLCATSKNQKSLCEVALYTADFLEGSTNDPLVALLVWVTRARLLASVYKSALSECKDLIELEISYSYKNAYEVFWQLDVERRKAALNPIYTSWFMSAKITRNTEIFRRLTEITGEDSKSLTPDKKVLYGIALCEAGDAHKGEEIIQSITQKDKSSLSSEQDFSLRLITFIAMNSFKIQNPDFESCKLMYGPFSSWIYDNASEQERKIDQYEDEISIPSHFFMPVFTYKNLAVLSKTRNALLSQAARTFVLYNQAYYNGQVFRTEEGTWLKTLRSVPCTQGLMFLELYGDIDKNDPSPENREILDLISTGYDSVKRDPTNAGLYITNTCNYFEHFMTNSADASYACGAILLGMAKGLLNDMDAVKSYLTYLQVMDHENALIYGKNKALLEL